MARWTTDVAVALMFLAALLAAPLSASILAPAPWAALPGAGIAVILAIICCWLIETGRSRGL